MGEPISDMDPYVSGKILTPAQNGGVPVRRADNITGRPPTAEDDADQGYHIGSNWADNSVPGTPVFYRAMDVTPGAAVWLNESDGAQYATEQGDYAKAQADAIGDISAAVATTETNAQAAQQSAATVAAASANINRVGPQLPDTLGAHDASDADIVDLGGKALTSFDSLGRHTSWGSVDLEVYPSLTGVHDAYPFGGGVMYLDGQVQIGHDPVTGLISFLGLNATEAARLLALAGGLSYATPTTFRDGRIALGASTQGNFLIGSATGRGGFVSQVKQRLLSTVATCVPDDPRPMQGKGRIGQSNAGQGGTPGINARKITDALFPSHCLGMAKSGVAAFQTSSATSPEDVSGYNDLLPLQDFASSAGNPQFQQTMFAFGLEWAYRRRGLTGPGMICHTDWYGGQALSTFVKGTPTYQNLIAHVGKMAQMAALYGRQFSYPTVILTQGESGPTNGTWNPICTQLVSDLRVDIPQAAGTSTPPIVLVNQINAKDDDAAPTSVPLEQLAVCKNSGGAAVMIGPMYFMRLIDPVSGGEIHPDAEGRAMLGEIEGEVDYRVQNGAWTGPLWSTAITLAADTISIDYNLPGDDLEWDSGDPNVNDGWVKILPNNGFFYSDSLGNTISSMAFVKMSNGRFSRLAIKLSGDATGATGRALSYARHVFDSTTDTWSTNRGGLRSRGPRSEMKRGGPFGLRIPDFIYFYACAEEWTL